MVQISPTFDLSPSRKRRWPKAAQALALLLATTLLLYWRRPDQFFSPYIWVEDGTVSLPDFLRHGWWSLADPVAGYLILPSKLIHATSLSLWASHYPEVAMVLTILFHAGVLCAVAFSPTSLRLPFACALYTLLIPTDSEVFGTSHYAFWWGSLLLMPVLLWRADAEGKLITRLSMSILGSLSSPLVIALLPLFALRSLFRRTWRDALVSITVIACAAVQFYFLRSSGTHGTTSPEHLSLTMLLKKFFGNFIYWEPGGDHHLWILAAGAALVALIAAIAIRQRTAVRWHHMVLGAALAASILISVTRMPVDVIDPIQAGPRYFFYPYIFLGWLILELMPVAPRQVAGLMAAILLCGLHQVYMYSPRGHHNVDWKGELNACASSTGEYRFPIHFAGNRDEMWHAQIPAAGCRRLLRDSVLR